MVLVRVSVSPTNKGVVAGSDDSRTPCEEVMVLLVSDARWRPTFTLYRY